MRSLIVVIAAAVFLGWRFMLSWRSAWDADTADWIRYQQRDLSTEYDD